MYTVEEVLSLVRGLPPVDRQRLRTELENLAAEDNATPSSDDFWHERNIEEFASLQGVAVPKTLDEVLGKGIDLWEDGAAFESFVRGLDTHAHRTWAQTGALEGRSPCTQRAQGDFGRAVPDTA